MNISKAKHILNIFEEEEGIVASDTPEMDAHAQDGDAPVDALGDAAQAVVDAAQQEGADEQALVDSVMGKEDLSDADRMMVLAKAVMKMKEMLPAAEAPAADAGGVPADGIEIQ